MPRTRPLLQLDVFSATPYFGNALAVVLDAQGLSDDAMQRFALWTNLAETTFILPPTPEAAAAGAGRASEGARAARGGAERTSRLRLL